MKTLILLLVKLFSITIEEEPKNFIAIENGKWTMAGRNFNNLMLEDRIFMVEKIKKSSSHSDWGNGFEYWYLNLK